MASVGKDMHNLEHCWWEQNGTAIMKILWQLYKYLNIEIPYDSIITLLGKHSI